MDYQNCTLCPRRCGVDRTAGQRGFCGMGSAPTAARAALHFWEEPPISGNNGSGAVFFSGCTLQCKFCQNYDISVGKQGKPISSARLREIFESLIEQGAHNINLVSPTHFLPSILPALSPKLPVPVVYNCGGYERVDTLKQLEGLVDVYLPDMKYCDPLLAASLSNASDYVQVAKDAICEMFRQTGPYRLSDGLLSQGVFIRHLILPGQIDNSLAVLDWIAHTFPKHSVLVSLMSQYVPCGAAKHLPPFDRTLRQDEYDAVLSWMYLNGLNDGFTQDFSAASVAYIPAFDGFGL